jgi:hypothetical protein
MRSIANLNMNSLLNSFVDGKANKTRRSINVNSPKQTKYIRYFDRAKQSLDFDEIKKLIHILIL